VAQSKAPLRASLLKQLILLELAAEGPSHGYAIAKNLENMIRGWRPSLGTLYRMMDELEREGYIECRREEKTGRQRKLCTLTEKGAHHLLEKLTTHMNYIACFMEVVAKAVNQLREYTSSREEERMAEIAERITMAAERIIHLLKKPTPYQASP